MKTCHCFLPLRVNSVLSAKWVNQQQCQEGRRSNYPSYWDSGLFLSRIPTLFAVASGPAYSSVVSTLISESWTDSERLNLSFFFSAEFLLCDCQSLFASYGTLGFLTLSLKFPPPQCGHLSTMSLNSNGMAFSLVLLCLPPLGSD